MRTITFVEKGRAEFVEEPKPGCPPEGMLLQTIYSGVTNGTERNVLLGGNYGGSWPARCGYQLVSRVIEVGESATGFAVGDIVYTGTFPGHVEYHTARPADLMVKLPEGCDLQAAALLGVASVPMHDIRRAGVTVDDRVLVVGAGLVGQFAAQAARVVGAEVTICDLDETRLALAAELGADHCVNSGTDEGLAELRGLAPFSVVVECSGADVLGLVIGGTWGAGLIAHRARVLVIAGRSEVTYSFNAGQGAEIALMQASHFDQGDLQHVLRHFLKGSIRVRPLIKNVAPIADALPIYETLRDNPNELRGTVFVW